MLFMMPRGWRCVLRKGSPPVFPLFALNSCLRSADSRSAVDAPRTAGPQCFLHHQRCAAGACLQAPVARAAVDLHDLNAA